MTGPLVRRLAASSMSRFPSIKPKQSGVVLVPGHSAEVEGRSLFPTTVNAVDDPRVKRLLKSGHNSRKIGRRVEKGRLTMAPIFTLTLEERKTCPRSCKTWRSCYGNGMPYAQRLVHGPQFEAMLWAELAALQRKHPRGFLVRLHVLGDFYSVEYVDLWAEALVAFPALNVFGFTARSPVSDPIGQAIDRIASSNWLRFAVRWSGKSGDRFASRVIPDGEAEDPDAITCPAQIGKAENCARCALCWQSTRSIAFIRH